MKKALSFCFLLICLLIPLNVKAASITGLNVSGTSSAAVGEEFTLTFKISYSGVQKGTNDTMGVVGLVFQLDFDTDDFIVTGGTTPGFDTRIYDDLEHSYVFSEINEYDNGGKCLDKVLHCDNYVATIKFYVRNTSKTSSSISISNANVVLVKVDSDYEEKDAITISNYSKSTHVVNIANTGSVVKEEPKTIASNSKPTNIMPKVESKTDKNKTTTTVATTSKPVGPNNNLKSLQIEGYKINFARDQLEYKIYLENKKVNKLNVKAEAEDSESLVNIIGSDDLKANKYKVLVEVTSKDGVKKVYNINVLENKKDSNFNFKLSKKIIKIIFISLGGIVVLIVLIVIMSKLKDKKLDKMLDDFDNL